MRGDTSVLNSWPKPATGVLIGIAIVSAGIGFLWGFHRAAAGSLTAPVAPVQAVEETLVHIFELRARALLHGNPEVIKGLYDADSVYGRWALEHEFRRLRYVEAWTKARGVRFDNVQTTIGIRTADLIGDKVRVFLVQTLKVKYGYTNDSGEHLNQFGIGTRHTMELVNTAGRWLIRRDWFTDPLEEDALVHDAEPARLPESGSIKPTSNGKRPMAPEPPRDASGNRFDRRAAVAYADKYTGLALGTNHRYNPAYRDHTNVGGDCTNFVSQVLTDKDGGKLPRDYTWTYYASRTGAGSGSRTWTQAPTLVNYLLYRGHARLIGRGGFNDLAKATAGHPYGAVGELREGDVIAYEEKGHIEHLAVVVDWDLHGYPLVNTHTADRYHVPWDLGWDRRTIFWLIQIND